MKIIFLILLFSSSCYSQTILQFDEVKGNDISTCDELKNGKICQSTFQLEIWLTRSAALFGRYESINLLFDGNSWKAKKYMWDWYKDERDTINLKPIHSYD